MKQKLCQNDAKKGSEIATKSKNTVKNERRNRCENLLLFKRCRKSKKLAQGVILSRYGAKDWSSGGGLSGAAAPRGRPQVRTRVIRKKGAAGRKKNQERKSKACGTRYKRDLNTQAARGPTDLLQVY